MEGASLPPEKVWCVATFSQEGGGVVCNPAAPQPHEEEEQLVRLVEALSRPQRDRDELQHVPGGSDAANIGVLGAAWLQ